jgi:hypothetical protein
VTVFRRDDWWFVGCEEDWLAQVSSGSVEDFFLKIVAFPAAGPNSMHSEILLAAFAKDVLIKEGEAVRALKGCGSEDDKARHILQGTSWQLGVAFRLEPPERD